MRSYIIMGIGIDIHKNIYTYNINHKCYICLGGFKSREFYIVN